MDMIETFMADALRSDFFVGGLALGAFGVIAASLRIGLRKFYGAVMRRIWVSLTLDNRSPAYRHFYIWMEHNDVLSKARHVRMTDSRWTRGTHGHICRLERNINEKSKVGPAQSQRPMETLHVTVMFGHVSTILGWIAAGKKIAETEDRIGPGLHVLRGDYWDNLGDIPRRSMDTVVVDDDRVKRVLEDMRWFYSAMNWYAERGVPWRRGYLFYGPPGTGKSTLIRAIASELSLDIANLDVGRATLTDDDLREAMISAPKRSLIAIEDVDAVFTQREGGEKQSGVSFSGLLNAIDGVAAQEGRALVMTTNHKDRLDPALIRPGRADVHTELGFVNAATARTLFNRFFPNDAVLGQQFEACLGNLKSSPAEIQGWLLANSADPKQAAGAEGLLKNKGRMVGLGPQDPFHCHVA